MLKREDTHSWSVSNLNWEDLNVYPKASFRPSDLFACLLMGFGKNVSGTESVFETYLILYKIKIQYPRKRKNSRFFIFFITPKMANSSVRMALTNVAN